jgi:hypothetical protein
MGVGHRVPYTVDDRVDDRVQCYPYCCFGKVGYWKKFARISIPKANFVNISGLNIDNLSLRKTSPVLISTTAIVLILLGVGSIC